MTACHRDVLFHLCCGENECHRAEPYDSLSSRRRSPFINALNNISSPPSPAGQSGQGTLNRMTVKCHNKNGMLTASTPLFPASLFLQLSHSFPPTSHPYTHTHTHCCTCSHFDLEASDRAREELCASTSAEVTLALMPINVHYTRVARTHPTTIKMHNFAPLTTTAVKCRQIQSSSLGILGNNCLKTISSMSSKKRCNRIIFISKIQND